MTLDEFAFWRLNESRRVEPEKPDLQEVLFAAALTALRAGVVPTLELLAESRYTEAAWLEAAEVFREEQALAAKGIKPGEAFGVAYARCHAEVKAKLLARKAGS